MEVFVTRNIMITRYELLHLTVHESYARFPSIRLLPSYNSWRIHTLSQLRTAILVLLPHGL